MKWIALILLVAAPEPSERDARDALKHLGAVQTLEPAIQLQLLVQGCAEIKTCADGCEKPLSDWANRRGPNKLRACPAFQGGDAQTWLRERLKAFYDRARPKLSPRDQKELDRLRGRIKL